MAVFSLGQVTLSRGHFGLNRRKCRQSYTTCKDGVTWTIINRNQSQRPQPADLLAKTYKNKTPLFSTNFLALPCFEDSCHEWRSPRSTAFDFAMVKRHKWSYWLATFAQSKIEVWNKSKPLWTFSEASLLDVKSWKLATHCLQFCNESSLNRLKKLSSTSHARNTRNNLN